MRSLANEFPLRSVERSATTVVTWPNDFYKSPSTTRNARHSLAVHIRAHIIRHALAPLCNLHFLRFLLAFHNCLFRLYGGIPGDYILRLGMLLVLMDVLLHFHDGVPWLGVWGEGGGRERARES
eukprot:scaffold922_cov327-Pinguiococcus_pyrenoidosus.AAC.31